MTTENTSSSWDKEIAKASASDPIVHGESSPVLEVMQMKVDELENQVKTLEKINKVQSKKLQKLRLLADNLQQERLSNDSGLILDATQAILLAANEEKSEQENTLYKEGKKFRQMQIMLAREIRLRTKCEGDVSRARIRYEEEKIQADAKHKKEMEELKNRCDVYKREFRKLVKRMDGADGIPVSSGADGLSQSNDVIQLFSQGILRKKLETSIKGFPQSIWSDGQPSEELMKNVEALKEQNANLLLQLKETKQRMKVVLRYQKGMERREAMATLKNIQDFDNIAAVPADILVHHYRKIMKHVVVHNFAVNYQNKKKLVRIYEMIMSLISNLLRTLPEEQAEAPAFVEEVKVWLKAANKLKKTHERDKSMSTMLNHLLDTESILQYTVNQAWTANTRWQQTAGSFFDRTSELAQRCVDAESRLEKEKKKTVEAQANITEMQESLTELQRQNRQLMDEMEYMERVRQEEIRRRKLNKKLGMISYQPRTPRPQSSGSNVSGFHPPPSSASGSDSPSSLYRPQSSRPKTSRGRVTGASLTSTHWPPYPANSSDGPPVKTDAAAAHRPPKSTVPLSKSKNKPAPYSQSQMIGK